MDLRIQSAIIILLLIGVNFAEDFVVVNSADGRDVLSGVFYANVKNIPVRFMASPGGNVQILMAKTGIDHDILLIQSKNLPISTFVESEVGKKNNVEILQSEDGGVTNLELAKKSGAKIFIIVDSAYSDSAISAMSYANYKNAYIIMTNKNNIAEVKNIIKGKKVIIFGYVDEKVKEELAEFNPEVIGTGEDKFSDNLAMVSKTLEEFNINRVIASDGTFLEDSITKADLPVLLIGRIIPKETYEFMKDGQKTGKLSGMLLIGNDLTYSLYDAREKIARELIDEGTPRGKLGVTIKFAQSITGSGGQVLGLDIFRMPAYKPRLEIASVEYNKKTSRIMLTINNIGDGAAYYSSEIRVRVGDAEIGVVGDQQPRLIERTDTAGTEYDIDITEVNEGQITASVITRYGASKTALEDFASYNGELTTIEFSDESEIVIKDANYDIKNKKFMITLQNKKEQTAFVLLKVEIKQDGRKINITSGQTRQITAGSIIVEEMPFELTQKDLENNKNIKIYAQYGAKSGFLNKEESYTIKLKNEIDAAGILPFLAVGAGAFAIIAVIIVIVIAIIIVAVFVLLKKKK